MIAGGQSGINCQFFDQNRQKMPGLPVSCGNDNKSAAEKP